MPRSRFPQAARVKRSDDFSEIIQAGAFFADDVLVVNLRQASDGGTRIGITIPKKTGNAVVRNRWKRWLREAFRLHQAELPQGFELIVRPKRGATGGFEAICSSLVGSANKAAKRARRRADSME